MGLVAIELKIMPSSPEENMENIRNAIVKLVKVQDSKIEPLAFGLKALNIVITAEDKGGGTDALENKIKGIPGVGDVEVVAVTLI